VSEPEPFDPCGPLPGAGVTVLEASAGTGKTFTLTTLVARYVAEGVPLPSILAVTFTRMATGELRERVRARLSDAVRLFDNPPDEPDALSGILTGGSPDAVLARKIRLRNALAEFDAATIATTHGFCQTVLRELGTAGSTAPGAVLLEDPTDIIHEVVEDLYLRRSLLHGQPPFSLHP
jgi:exodeoxyribonuclease V beta subunit